MNRFFLRGLGAIAIVGLFISALSCARDQQLVSIEIQPGAETFGASNIPVPADAGLQVQLRALGHYVHPPVTKDITDQVVWASNTPQIATVTATGLLTAAGQACGGALVSATITNNTSSGDRTSTGALVTAQMTTNVVCFTGVTGNEAILDVILNPSGDGTVSISGGGLAQPFICSVGPDCPIPFTPGATNIILNAVAASGHSFTGWTGCLNQSGPEQCTIDVLDVDAQITANFN